MNESTNPKDKLGRQKPPLHLVPASANIAEAGVFALGAEKYGPFNWREHSVSASVYVSALYRHVAQWFDGEDIDGESGESHLAHARACLGILLDAKACNKLVDDRPLKGGASSEIKARLAEIKVQEFYDALPEHKKEYVTDHNAEPKQLGPIAREPEPNTFNLFGAPVTLSEHDPIPQRLVDLPSSVLHPVHASEHIAEGEEFTLFKTPEDVVLTVPDRKQDRLWSRNKVVDEGQCVALTRIDPKDVVMTIGRNAEGRLLCVGVRT